MAEGVVDLLKVVEIHEEHRDFAAALVLGASQRKDVLLKGALAFVACIRTKRCNASISLRPPSMAASTLRPLYDVGKERVRSSQEKLRSRLAVLFPLAITSIRRSGKEKGANSDDLETDQWVHLADSGIEIILDTKQT